MKCLLIKDLIKQVNDGYTQFCAKRGIEVPKHIGFGKRQKRGKKR